MFERYMSEFQNKLTELSLKYPDCHNLMNEIISDLYPLHWYIEITDFKILYMYALKLLTIKDEWPKITKRANYEEKER